MRIKSYDLINEEILPEFTCVGTGISPELEIIDFPAETEELVLLLSDPDAPSGEFIHWMVFNVSPTNPIFEKGRAPQEAIEAINDSGASGYIGPCPPSGKHRYIFNVFALNKKLDLQSDISKNQLIKEMEGKVIDSYELIRTFEKKI